MVDHMIEVGFIDYFLDEWHANNYPKWLEEASNGLVKVTRAFGLIDSPRGGRSTEAWCREMGIEQCETEDEIIEKSEVLIVLSPDHCEMHERLCAKALASGKPTYVDKTFAPDFETAKRIFDNAREHFTPCYSTSALRFAKEYQEVTALVQAIASWGPYGFETYAIHQLEPVMMLMKGRVKRVMALPSEGMNTLLMDFEDGRTASVTTMMGGAPFTLNIASPAGNRVVTANSDYFRAFIVALVEFFKTGVAPVEQEETLAIMAVRGAGALAQEQPGMWVKVPNE